eukprot:2642246-Rhodomonas_salina.4
MVVRMCYAVPGTDECYALTRLDLTLRYMRDKLHEIGEDYGMCLRTRSAMPGTDAAYAASEPAHARRYAMRGTETAYGGMAYAHAVLRQRMVLPGFLDLSLALSIEMDFTMARFAIVLRDARLLSAYERVSAYARAMRCLVLTYCMVLPVATTATSTAARSPISSVMSGTEIASVPLDAY